MTLPSLFFVLPISRRTVPASKSTFRHCKASTSEANRHPVNRQSGGRLKGREDAEESAFNSSRSKNPARGALSSNFWESAAFGEDFLASRAR